MTRYQSDCGTYPEPTKACFTISGPQNEDQIPEGVKLILAMPGVTQVDVRFNHGQGDRIEVFRKIDEKPRQTHYTEEDDGEG